MAAFTSYVENILQELADHPERRVLTTSEGRDVTAAEFHDSVHRTAAELAGRGIGRGHTVSMLSGNRPEALSARYAVNLLGARIVLLYEGQAPETQARVVESAETVLLLVGPESAEPAAELLSHLDGTAPDVLLLAPGDPGDLAGLDAEDLSAAAAARPSGRTVESAARPDDDWCIRYTGGTTGVPKGIQMAHRPYAQAVAYPFASVGDPARLLVCTSLAHLAGQLSDMTLAAGGSVVLQEGFDAGAVLAAVARERITHMWLLPPLLYHLLDHPDLATTDLSSLTRITYGGCPASPSRLRQGLDLLGPVLYGWYGQSEALLLTEMSPEEHGRTGQGGQITVGRPVPGVTVEIRDEDGHRLPPDTGGEVYVRSEGMMTGYWKKPELTAQVIRDGWIRTGDVGYLDDAGYLYLMDRVKDMVIVVGGHVYPGELEDLLHTHPDVAHCAAFGVRTADEVEEVHVAVVPTPGRTVDPAAITDFVVAHKGAMYAPRGVHQVDTIPLTSVGKPDKKRLKAEVVEG
ncbi:fatty acid CoA ligase [Streptomyces chrestomyceticus JCM 4735]|uniref:Fatty acid CoA ligase n=1 Tax=Streptomyces chrestomyceticus JCM 4735 TaxID=1306181 RepID=A0A7U9Q0T7_9ACTN|nr:AMP-binding protein [Streptomyces chrestomyceticus]GCD38225.1 fatty acid CoA ligase [Streptomyces chrestomyceticus JCM 4735]